MNCDEIDKYKSIYDEKEINIEKLEKEKTLSYENENLRLILKMDI